MRSLASEPELYLVSGLVGFNHAVVLFDFEQEAKEWIENVKHTYPTIDLSIFPIQHAACFVARIESA